MKCCECNQAQNFKCGCSHNFCYIHANAHMRKEVNHEMKFSSSSSRTDFVKNLLKQIQILDESTLQAVSIVKEAVKKLECFQKRLLKKFSSLSDIYLGLLQHNSYSLEKWVEVTKVIEGALEIKLFSIELEDFTTDRILDKIFSIKEVFINLDFNKKPKKIRLRNSTPKKEENKKKLRLNGSFVKDTYVKSTSHSSKQSFDSKGSIYFPNAIDMDVGKCHLESFNNNSLIYKIKYLEKFNLSTLNEYSLKEIRGVKMSYDKNYIFICD